MKAKIALATVSGKAYYLLVNELNNMGVPFLSLTPYEPIPLGIKVVITTEKERPLIRHETVLVFKDGMDPPALLNQALQNVEGKNYEKIVIGVDLGEVSGLAVLADGKVIKTENCFGMNELLSEIENILKNLKDVEASTVIVKVGDGVPEHKDKLLNALDRALPPQIVLESVREYGTNQNIIDSKNRRGLRDIDSAIKIARRNGYRFTRRTEYEHNR